MFIWHVTALTQYQWLRISDDPQIGPMYAYESHSHVNNLFLT